MNRGNDMPEKGARMQINVGSGIVAGVCLSNECRSDMPASKGKLIPGLGRMKADNGHVYWFTAEEWFNE